jgi:hypothetical protein
MQLTPAVLDATEALDLRVTLCCVRWPIAAPLVCKQLAALAGLLLARCCLLLLRMVAGCALPGREVRQLLVFFVCAQPGEEVWVLLCVTVLTNAFCNVSYAGRGAQQCSEKQSMHLT